MRLTTKTAVSFAALLVGLLAYGDASAGTLNRISGLQSTESGSSTILTIAGNATPTFTVYKLERPSRLVVDVAGAELNPRLVTAGEGKASWNINSWSVSQVVASARTDRGSKLVRVVVSLARSSSYRVKANGNKLVVRVKARQARPANQVSEADLAAARKAAEAKASAATRLANERARQAEARAEAEAKRASAISANAAQKRKAEVAKRKAAEARLAAALAEISAAKTRARVAEREMAAAKASATKAKKAANARAAAAAKEARAAKAAARRASAEAAQRLKAAEKRISTATKQAKRARQLLAAAEKARADAKMAAAAAAASEKTAARALARANSRRAEAEKAEKAAARVREKADRAKATGSAESAKLARRAEEAAQAAEKRRSAAEAATRTAEARRKDAERAERKALARSKETSTALAAAERRRKRAEASRRAAEAAREKAQLENRELIAKIDSAKSRAKEASNRADSYVKAAEVARAQADEARSSRLAEERALEKAARARVVAERNRAAAEKAATDLKRSVADLKRAEALIAKRRVAANRAAKRATGASSTDRAKRNREAAASAKALAKAEKALSLRKKALAASEKKARKLESTRKKAAAELTSLKRAAAVAKRERLREEKLAAELDARRKNADRALRKAETRLAAAQRDRERARSAAIAAEAARAEAEKQRAAARVSRSKADDELRLAEAQRRKADADRKEAAALKEKSARTLAKAKRTRLKAERSAQAAKKRNRKVRSRAARVNDVKFVDKGNAARVVVGLSAPAKPKVIKNRGKVAVLEIKGVKMAKDLERTLDTSAFRGPIKAVSSYRDPKNPDTVRVVVDLYKPARGVLKKVGNTYYWDFPNANGKRSNGRLATKSRTSSYGSTRVASSAANATASTSITQQTVAQSRPGRRRVYRGRRIDLNFKDADIHNLLRILATVGGVNIVVPQSVTGSVTVRLKSVPWDQAMEVILSSQGLWYRRDGSLIRIAKRETLEKEDEDEGKRRAALIKAEAPEPEIFTLNYADATAIRSQLGGLVSPKGRIEINDRTNSLIINDIAAHRRRIIDLATRLDTQTPQIQIEARIVEARTTFVREFGIQWGGNAAATPQGGNPTGLVFPNSVGLAGASDDGNTPTAGVSQVPPNFAVNLPAAIGTGSGGGLGLSLGSVGGNFNINLRLSALEDTGSARIISAPKISVSNNIQARIKSGVSIPISVVSANGTQTQFVPADLALDVTPKVSQRDCSISMVVNVTKNEADFANTGARGDPSILTKEAQTTILVADGETAVIGGIYTRNTGLNYSKVPFFADIPVIGHFFKNRRENDERSEVLVFVTPKITNRAFLRCQ